MTCYVYGGDTVGASTTVTATLTGVTNPPAGSPTLAVSTTSDVTPATSPTYTVTADRSVSGVRVTITPPTSAAGGLTTYVVSFTTSSTGALDGDSGSTVTIALPANTGLGSLNDGYYYYSTLDVGATQIGYCEATDTSAGTPTVTCYVDGGDTVGASTTVTATLTGVTNPAGRLTHPGRVDHLGLHPGDLTGLHGDRGPIGERGERHHHAPDLGGRRADHLRGLLHHLVDRRTGRQRREHRHHRPAGQHRPRLLQQRVLLLQLARRRGHPDRLLRSHRHQQRHSDRDLLRGRRDTVGASTTVTATLTGVTNPAAGPPTLAVSTSSDVTPATSPAYTVTTAQSVSGVSVTVSPPTSAAGGLTTYAVSFTTSSTGALDGNAGSTVERHS